MKSKGRIVKTVINRCADCPNVNAYFYQAIVCSLTFKEVKNDCVIQDWCPLEREV